MDYSQLPKRFGLNQNKFQELLSAKKVQKFDSDIRPMRNLKFFVDLSKPIQQLNALQQQKVKTIIDHLKYQAQTRKVLESQQENKKHLIAISKQLEFELDQLNNLEAQDEQKQSIMDLIQLKFSPKDVAKMIQESSSLIDTHYNILQIKEQITNTHKHSKSARFNSTGNELEFNFLKKKNSDQQEFFQDVLSQTERKPKVDKSAQNLSMKEKFQILRDYLKKKGISLEDNQKVQHQAYLQYFTDQSNRLIKSTRDQQIIRLRSMGKSQTFSRNIGNENSPSIRRKQQIDGSPIHLKKLSRFGQNKDQVSTQQSSTSPYLQINHEQSVRDFMAKAQAIQSFYHMENQEYKKCLTDLDSALKKPWKQHFNEIKQLDREEDDMEIAEKQNKIIRNKKRNYQKSVRMIKIFKSELN